MWRAVALGMLVASWGTSFACSVFFVFDGKLALAGDNKDWIDQNTQVWFVPKAGKEGKLRSPRREIPEGGVINVKPSDVYGFPQSGVNDQGLFFAGAATDLVSEPNRSGRPRFEGYIFDHVLRNCATVPEALVIIEKADIGLPQGQIMIGDKLGNSAIIEAGNVVLRGNGKHQVMTNFRLSSIVDGAIECRRYKKLDATLRNPNVLTVEFARDAVASVASRPRQDALETKTPGTQYSIVFDLTNEVVYLYHQADFRNPIRLVIRDELAKGKRAEKISRLYDPLKAPAGGRPPAPPALY